ncbi:MAG: ion transporter [Cypionkella sp.]
MRTRLKVSTWLGSVLVGRGIVVVILINAILLGLETSPAVMGVFGPPIEALDSTCLAIFVVELALKLYALRSNFFRSGWNLFDFVIIGISLIPGAQSLSVLRALRVLRVLRVVSVAPSLRRVVEGFVTALPGMGSVFLLMALIYYIASVMATKLFANSFPVWFGDMGRSAYSLFQIMTLESWSMGIVRPVMEVYPYAWAFFLPFIMVTTFTVVNLLVGLIVTSMQSSYQDESAEKVDAQHLELVRRLEAIEGMLKHRDPPN